MGAIHLPEPEDLLETISILHLALGGLAGCYITLKKGREPGEREAEELANEVIACVGKARSSLFQLKAVLSWAMAEQLNLATEAAEAEGWIREALGEANAEV